MAILPATRPHSARFGLPAVYLPRPGRLRCAVNRAAARAFVNAMYGSDCIST